jgi:predicted regulator of Ras-like GTPase activity (Roadblock/LC7/MglB family)
VDAAQALADLKEISPQIEAAVIFDEEGAVEGSTLLDEERSREVARLGRQLLDEATTVRSQGASPLAQLQTRLRAGSVFVLREGGRSIAATTGDEPTVGLVFYDLRSALRSVAEKPEETKKGVSNAS